MSAAAYAPWRLGPLSLRNRLIKSATNAGMADGARVTDRLIEFHRRMAAGGVGMTTLAYCAVSRDGRTFEDQVCLDAQTLPRLRALTDAVHAEGAAACAQITHGGAFCFLPQLEERRYPLSARGGLNPPGMMIGRWFKRAATAADLEHLTAQFVNAARLAREAGFDALEIHMGHGYLLSQFLSPLYNHEPDARARSRFPRRVLEAVLDAVGNDLAVLCKLSVVEGHRRGNSIEDMIQICRELEQAGAHQLVLSAGMNVEAPWTIFGNRLPVASMTAAAKGLFRPIAALMALRQPRKPFQPLYLMPWSSRIRAAVDIPLAYLGGVTSPDDVTQVLAEGFDSIALGRVLIHDPDLPRRWAAGEQAASGCTACNLCVASMYSARGTHCALTDQPVPAGFSHA